MRCSMYERIYAGPAVACRAVATWSLTFSWPGFPIPTMQHYCERHAHIQEKKNTVVKKARIK